LSSRHVDPALGGGDADGDTINASFYEMPPLRKAEQKMLPHNYH
jgi:hypothetical protein